MKLKISVLMTVLALAGSAVYLVGQDNDNGQGPRRGPGNRRPPIPPVIAALDANHDGVVDSAEIDNAPAALRKLDRNGDGQLTMDELLPPPPRRGPGGPGGPGGPNGFGGPGGPDHQAPPPGEPQQQ